MLDEQFSCWSDREAILVDQWLREVVNAVLPPLITAGLAALGLWLSERGKDRNAAHFKRQALADENDRVAYLKLWLEADDLVGDTGNADARRGREEVRRQLAASRDRLDKIELNKPRDDAPSALLRAWRKAALIPLTQPAARAVRWVYWCVIIFGLAYLAAIIALSGGTEYGLIMVIFTAVIVSIPLLAVALLLAYWAKNLERHRKQAPVPSGPSWHAVLGYHPGPTQDTQPKMPNHPPRAGNDAVDG